MIVSLLFALFMPPPEVVRVADAHLENGKVVQSYKYVIVFKGK